MKFNKKRQLLISWLMEEYCEEDAINQIANANVIHLASKRYSIQYDNGRCDLVIIKDNEVVFVE